MTQVLIVVSLALSILTFTVSIIELLPERENHNKDHAKQEALEYNTFLCLILPLVVAYCSQSSIISMMTQKCILMRVCNLSECFSKSNFSSRPPPYLRSKHQLLGEAFSQGKASLGLTCTKTTGPINLSFFQPTS